MDFGKPSQSLLEMISNFDNVGMERAFWVSLHHEVLPLYVIASDNISDYGVPQTEPVAGDSLSSGSLVRFYTRRLMALAVKDEHAGLVVYRSAQALGTPIDAFHPFLVCKILFDIVLHPFL
jgi:hypothetical protein